MISEKDIDIIVNRVLEVLKTKNDELKESKAIGKLIAEKNIIDKVSDYTGITREEMRQKRRIYEHVRSRYIVFVELMRNLGYSQGEAAAVFNYDHATALYASRKLTGGEYQSTKYYNEYLKNKAK